MNTPPDGSPVSVLTEAGGATYWICDVIALGNQFFYKHTLTEVYPVLSWEIQCKPHYNFAGRMERLTGANWHDSWRVELAKRNLIG